MTPSVSPITAFVAEISYLYYMARIVAIVGTYRKHGIVDSAVDAILEAARQNGADTKKINLLDKHIEFCTNCRSCTQQPGSTRGKCIQQDDLESILTEIDSADTLVLASPVNFFNVTAVFRRFMERLVGYAYWPWKTQGGPVTRNKKLTKKAALVTSAAMPTPFIPFATGAPRALKITAEVLGAKSIAKLWIGFSAIEQNQRLSPRAAAKARHIGHLIA